VIGLVFSIATVMGIDLEQAIIKKWISKERVKRK
jgi:NTP pyrophosphatase (non-canonical NTP hydrolase)